MTVEESFSASAVVEPLSSRHDVAPFDCGKHESLNQWLRRFALINQRNDTSRTYVIHRDWSVVGYYSIAAGSVSRDSVPERIAKGLAAHPIRTALVTRLAIDKSCQGRGLGQALLRNAFFRVEQAANILGIRAVVVHAIDQEAADFYRHFGFE